MNQPGGSSIGSTQSGRHRPPVVGFHPPVLGDPSPGSPGLPSTGASAPWYGSEQPTVISSPTGSSHRGPVLTGQEWGEALVGQVLGEHYELHALVGTGGMGAVYRGHDQALNKTVAIKVLLPNCGDEELLRRFKNEAQSAARLDHPHSARVHYVGEDRGLHFIVYEFIEGRNIRDLVMSGGALSVEDAIRYTYQIADTLAHAAECDVVHRDIKPSNILVTPKGSAKLVDMGLARLHQVEHTDGHLTASGVTLGTFDFISPEQARDPRTADVRSDLYSLGCTLFFMLTGKPPFSSGTVLQKLLQHEKEPPPDVRNLRADVSDELAGILATLLAKQPEQRYQTPAALMSDLVRISRHEGYVSVGAGAPVTVAAAPARELVWQKHAPWMAALVGIVMLVVLLDSFWSTDESLVPLEPIPAGPAVAVERSASANERRARDQGNGIAPGSIEQKSPAEKETSPRVEGKADARASAARGADEQKPADERSLWEKLLDEAAAKAASMVKPSRGAAEGTAEARPDVRPRTNGATAAEPGQLTFVVGDNEETADAYSSLDRAAAAATAALRNMPEMAVRIELRHNGPLTTLPIALEGVRATIAAAEGFSPVIAFTPDAREAGPRTMIRIAAGQLVLERVHVDFTAPEGSKDNWVVFEAHDAELIRLRDSTVTVRAAGEDAAALEAPGTAQTSTGQINVSVFAATSRRGPDAIMAMPDAQRGPAMLALRLERAVVRGDAALLHVGGVQNVRLTWNNGLAVLSRPLLMVTGSREMSPAAHVKVSLSHVTAALGGGLASIVNRQEAPYCPAVDFECFDNIFAGETAPLVSQAGVDSIEDFRERFRWNGERNFYEGWPVLWRVHGVGFESAPEEFDFRAWLTHWGRAESAASSGTIWRGPLDWERLPCEQAPADFHLAEIDTNPARGSGERGADAGALFEQLPSVPMPDEEDSAESTPLVSPPADFSRSTNGDSEGTGDEPGFAPDRD